MNLKAFLTQVDDVIDSAISNATFHPLQRELLNRTVQRYRPLAARNPMGDPTWRSTLYLIARAWKRSIDAQVVEAAAFTTLYLLAADLMDDVQDADLQGKPHEEAGPALAINDAVALLFLALQRLSRVIELERNPERKQVWLRVFNGTSLRAVAGQYRDLLGAAGAAHPDEVLDMLRDRNSSLSMIMQYAALLGRCSDEQLEIYANLGEKITTYCQIREDLSDIFGKEISPDLGTRKCTYPVACFLESASESERLKFDGLLSALPASLREIRVLLYDSGAVALAADTMERLREEIHIAFASLDNPCAAHRCLLSIVDSFAESVYEPPAIEVTRPFYEPDGTWHDWVRAQMELFIGRMLPLGFPGKPMLRPWHLPHWMYDPSQGIIYYPDLEGLADEILPELAELLGIDDLELISRLEWEQAPALLAHEMFHYWRAARARLTEDYWHEEWVANVLAVAYAQLFEPAALTSSLTLADRVLAREAGPALDAQLQLLDQCHQPRPGVREGYDMPARAMVHVTLGMVRRIAAHGQTLEGRVAEWLSVSNHEVHVVAA